MYHIYTKVKDQVIKATDTAITHDEALHMYCFIVNSLGLVAQIKKAN